MSIITPSCSTTPRVKSVNSAQKSTLIFHCSVFRRFLLSAIFVPLFFLRRHHHNHSYFVNCWTTRSALSKHHLSAQNTIHWVQNYQSIQQNRRFSKEWNYYCNSAATLYHPTLFVQKQSRLLNSLSDSKQQTSTQSWDNLTVVQLKEIIREKGLKVSGRKAELIERLVQHKVKLGVADVGEEEHSKMPPRRSNRKRNNESTATLKKEEDVAEDTSNVEEVKNESKQNDVKEKVVSKSKRIKVDPQRITERDELSKLWNAEEALATKGSYSKLKGKDVKIHFLCYERGVSIITLNLILVYILSPLTHFAAFKVMSWNVAGLRALVRKEPDALSNLAKDHDLDLICLQETKLQKMHLDDPKLKLKEILVEDGFESHWSCSTAKKGYAGTCVFVKRQKGKKDEDDDGNEQDTKKQTKLNNFFIKTKKTEEKIGKASEKSPTGDIDVKDLIPSKVSMEMEIKEHDQEGRIITVEYPHFTLTNLYVPNSGQKLERLSYRTEKWDKDLLNYMKQKEETRKKPVIWLGDLNVAHKPKDVWNDGAKHLAKQAGTTAAERESFQQMLDFDNGSFVDAFRHFYPEAKGHYSYWSQRAGNREPNKGLRLDYFICSATMMKDDDNKKVVVRDSYMIQSQQGSDHCPVVLEIEIRK